MEGLKMLRFIFILKTSDYDFPRALQGPQEGPKGCHDTALAVSIDWTKWHPVCWQTDHWWWILEWSLSLDKAQPKYIVIPIRRKPHTFRRWTHLASIVAVGACCVKLAVHCFIKEVNGNFTPCAKMTIHHLFHDFWVYLSYQKRYQPIPNPIHTN